MLIIEPSGENRVPLAAGALAHLTREHVRACEERIARADVCLVSLEIALEASNEALVLARRRGVTTILNPAPAPVPEAAAPLGAATDIVTPNAGEARAIGGRDGTAPDLDRAILAIGARSVIMTLGERGALIAGGASDEVVAAESVREVIDTSGAGDASNAGLAVAVARGAAPLDAVRYANQAAALILRGPGFVKALDEWTPSAKRPRVPAM